jgi:hypothetical protein
MCSGHLERWGRSEVIHPLHLGFFLGKLKMQMTTDYKAKDNQNAIEKKGRKSLSSTLRAGHTLPQLSWEKTTEQGCCPQTWEPQVLESSG